MESVVSARRHSEPKTYPITKATTKAIIIWCSQPSLQLAVRKFIQEEIGLIEGEYVPIPVPGAILSLAEPDLYPEHYHHITATAKFFLDEADKERRIYRGIFLNHRACRMYYETRQRMGELFLHGCGCISDRQKLDYKSAESVIAGLADRPWKFESHFLQFAGDDENVHAERV